MEKNTNIITEITIDKKEYINLYEIQIKKKIQKLPKKHLFQLVENDEKSKSYSKIKLVDLIYSLYFVNST